MSLISTGYSQSSHQNNKGQLRSEVNRLNNQLNIACEIIARQNHEIGELSKRNAVLTKKLYCNA